MFIFGGQHGYPDEDDGFVEGNNSELYKLNLVTLCWKHLKPTSIESLNPLPCEKGLMTNYKGNILVFGGYSEAPDPYKVYPIKPRFDFDSKSFYDWPRHSVSTNPILFLKSRKLMKTIQSTTF